MTGFVKRYPRAVVRIARPRPGRDTWGPMWRVWMIGPHGNIIRNSSGQPDEMTVSPRLAALEDAHLAVGITRRLRGLATAEEGGLR